MTAAPNLPSGTSTLFPRAYLLGIYTAAMEQGFIWITPLREADAASLRAKLYRLRRRSDTSNKAFITPQHALVTFGEWEPGPDGNGRMAAAYSAHNSEGPALPGFLLADGTPYEPSAAPAASIIALPDVAAIPVADLQLTPESIDDFVSRMVKDAGEADG